MRGLKSTLALLVVLAGLGAYIYFTSDREPGASGDKKEDVFAKLESGDVTEFTLKTSAGEATTVKKGDDGWQIVAPVTARASDSEVSTVTSTLDTLELVRVIEENATDLSPYGLDAPLVDIDFKSADGKPSGHLLLGQKTPTGANLYAMRAGEKRVFLVPAFQESSLNRSTFDLRDKTVVKFERDKVTGVDIDLAKTDIKLEKGEGEWKLTAPVAARADFGTVEGLVGRIETAQMKSIVAEDAQPADLKKYGLEPPQATITMHLGGEQRSVLLGRATEEGGFYVKDGARPGIFTVDKAFGEDLKKQTDDYRRRDIFEFRAFNADRLEVARSGQTVVFEKTKGSGENPQEVWRRTNPNAADVDRSKMDTLLAGFADLRATEFVASAPASGDMTTVSVTFDGKKQERASFGRAGGNAYASLPGEAGAAKIEAEKLDEAIRVLEELSK
jgi:hypothetical protein